MNKYFVINEKSTAIAINYLGFKYMQFTNNDGSTIYSFENSEQFQEARNKLWDLRMEYRK